jgi:hypothetical protein
MEQVRHERSRLIENTKRKLNPSVNDRKNVSAMDHPIQTRPVSHFLEPHHNDERKEKVCERHENTSITDQRSVIGMDSDDHVEELIIPKPSESLPLFQCT